MATVTIAALTTKNNPDIDPNTKVTRGTLGEANGAAVKPVYLNSSDNKWYLTNSSGTAEQAGASGIGITTEKGQVDEPVNIILEGTAVAEASLTERAVYVAGGTAAGDINPDVDAGSWRKTVLFVAGEVSGSNVEILIKPIVSPASP